MQLRMTQGWWTARFIPVLLGIYLLLGAGCAGRTGALSPDPALLEQLTAAYDASCTDFDSLDGRNAVAMFSQESLRRAEDLRTVALYGDAAQLAALPLLEQLEVVLMRFLLTVDDLRQLPDGRAIRLRMVEAGCYRTSISFRQVSARGAARDGDRAVLSLSSERQGYFWSDKEYFVLENGFWKLDWLRYAREREPEIRMYMSETRMTAQDYLLLALQAVSRRYPTEAVFEPLLPAQSPAS